jgi:uncharacterized protein YggE
MKNFRPHILALLLPTLLCTNMAWAQVAGNVNYQQQVKYSDNTINVNYPNNGNLLVDVKGMANIKADNYVAIFNVEQTGKTTEEVNTLFDERVNLAIDQIKAKRKDVEVYVDMISFVPVYAYEVEKKIFSKKTYNEVPAGFELKKNIHIKYTEPSALSDIISILSANEIYDLIRVDYFSNNLEAIKKQLMDKAKLIVQDKIKNYEAILGASLTAAPKSISDGYKVVLPVEMYSSYQAYSSSSLTTEKSTQVSQAEKSTTLYYQPIIDKEFDFVINPTVFEPVIQVEYEIKLLINREIKEEQKPAIQYILITPNGEMKNLDIKK